MISIIVPVYNAERYLDDCINSIVNQTYKDLEIILVNDGSADRSAEICDQWKQKDKRVRVIHKENEGPSAARNAALEIAQGEYLYFVDADDYIAPDLCERVLTCFDHYDTDIVTFDSYLVNENGKVIGSTEKKLIGIISKDEALILLAKGHINHYLWNKIYKRKVFDKIQLPKGRVWEDVATTYKLFLNCNNIYCYPEKLYYYVQRSGSITHSINAKALQDIFLARHEMYLALKDEYPRAAQESMELYVLAARRLYDRSLWEEVDEKILKQCKEFLADNKETILRMNRETKMLLFYKMPKLYRLLRKAKHFAGMLLEN